MGKKAPAGGAAAQKPAGAAAASGKADGESPYAEHTVKLLAGACKPALIVFTSPAHVRNGTCGLPHQT